MHAYLRMPEWLGISDMSNIFARTSLLGTVFLAFL